MAPRQPYNGSNKTRAIEGGVGVVRTQDLHAHQDGTFRRHGADTIDMNPVLSGGFGQATVQSVLATISTFITDSGQGFISIGQTPDGYDAGDFNVTASFPLEEAIEAAQLSPRLQQGGVILIKSGTYRLNRMVVLRQGIRIMGEPSGTIIISATNQQAMFEIPTSPTPPDLGNWQGLFPNNASTGVRYNSFYNIVLADNLDGYKGASPTIPNTITAGNLALIQCNRGSYLICEKVTFLGKVHTTTVPEVVTRRAIDYIGNSAVPTVLTMHDCYFDAFENCVTFTPTTGKNFLSIKSCRMRFLGQNTGSPPADRASAISFNICNANIEGNYILGDTSAKYAIELRNFALADSQLLEASSATDDLIPRIVLIGNSGGLATGSASERAQNFFVNSSSNSAFRMVNSGNTWGSNAAYSWGVVIGDGSTSIGDINGTKALDVAVLASQNSRSEAAIYINPGNYTYTTAGDTNTLPRLIGNIRGSGQRPVVSLSSSSTDSLSRKQVFVGSEIRNIKFTSVSTFHVISLNTGTSNIFRNLIVDNCEFYDAGLQTVTFANTTIQTLETRIKISNSRFYQSATYDDNLSCYLLGEFDEVSLEDSSFTGYGYALNITDPSGTYKQSIILNNVIFDNLIGNGTTVMISDVMSGFPTDSIYFRINSSAARVVCNNVKLISVPSLPSDLYPVGSVVLDGYMTEYVYIVSKSFSANNCSFLCPQQTYTSTVSRSLVGVRIEPRNYLYINNSEFRGSTPLYIGGISGFTDADATDVSESNGSYCTITNSIIASYPNISGNTVNSFLCDLDINAYEGSRDSSKPKIIIDGCQFENYKIGTATYSVEHFVNVSTDYRGAGLVSIIAKGWSVSFVNNTVQSFQFNSAASGISGLSSVTTTSAVFIDTIGNDSGTSGLLRNASVHISGNDIIMNTAGTTGGSSYIWSCLYFRTAFGNVSDNLLNFRSVTAIESTPYRIYLGSDISLNNSESTNKAACNISNNTFERYQALSKAMILFNTGLGQNCLFSDNIFTTSTVVGSSSSPQFVDNTTAGWTKVRNKNQTGIISLHSSHGSVVWGTSSLYVSDLTSAQFNISAANLADDVMAVAPDGSECLAIRQVYNGGGIDFNWMVPLINVFPIGTRIFYVKFIVDITSAWTSGTFRMQVGGNTTGIVPATVSATGAGSNPVITWSEDSLSNTLEVNLENNPFIIVNCSSFLSANNTTQRNATIRIEISYKL